MAVADEPKLILEISPIASISSGLKILLLIYLTVPSLNIMVNPPDFHGDMLFTNAHHSIKPLAATDAQINRAILLLAQINHIAHVQIVNIA